MNQKYAFGVKVMFLFLFFSFQMSGQDRAQDFENEYNIRPISEINAQGYGDAYPWISEDGLRLYYTSQDINDSNSCIWSAKRTDIFSAFEDFNKLSINDETVDNLSSWLSHDELNIAFVKRKRKGAQMTSIMLSSRTNIEDSFDEPKKLIINGPVKGTLLSPSFTPDLSELILYNEYNKQKFLLVFKRIENNIYEFTYQINIPKKYTIKTGKLSQDGLNYYVSLEYGASKPKVYVLTRNSIDDHFDKLVPINNKTLNNKTNRNHQPHFSNNKQFVVFTRSAENEWKHNEIFIGQIETINMEAVEIEETFTEVINLDLSIYPNPSSDFVSISNPGNRDIRAQIYDAHGKLVQTLNSENLQEYIDVSRYQPGTYVFRIQDIETAQERTFRVLVID